MSLTEGIATVLTEPLGGPKHRERTGAKMSLSKIGGIAALVLVAGYAVGIGLTFTVLDTSGFTEPSQRVAFLAAHQWLFYLETLFIYVIFGVCVAVLALALHERLEAGSPAPARLATAFGLIWAALLIASGIVSNIGMGKVVDLYGKDPAQAAAAWVAISAVAEGLGGGNEIAGGLWTLLVSWAAVRAGVLPRAVNYLGVVAGVAGLLTVIPAFFAGAVAVYALGQMVWWVWLASILLRSGLGVEASTPAALPHQPHPSAG